jgi:hypothetical protein
MFKFLRKTSLYLLAIPLLTFMLGVASNQAVLIANHDKFPVLLNDRKLAKFVEADAKEDSDFFARRTMPARVVNGAVMIDDVHCNMTKETHLNTLADIFDMHDAIYSVGDFLIELGSWLLGFAPVLFLFDVSRKLKE